MNIKKIIIILLILPISYMILMEVTLKDDFGWYENTTIEIQVYQNGDIYIPNYSMIGFSRNFIFERSVISPIYQLGKLTHIKKEYYMCFENYGTILVLEESYSEDFLDAMGYVYKPINEWRWDYKQQTDEYGEFFDNFPKYTEITKAKLTNNPDCSDFENIYTIYEYDVEIIYTKF
jgi:hypothetical protein